MEALLNREVGSLAVTSKEDCGLSKVAYMYTHRGTHKYTHRHTQRHIACTYTDTYTHAHHIKGGLLTE